MAEGSKKKRQASPAHSHTVATKRSRRASHSASAQDAGNAPSSVQPAFRGERDPYFPSRLGRTASLLPTNDDRLFRVKVISSTTSLDDHIFKNAVQGLVKICFPQGVLEKLGVDVLECHMEEENAPKANIKKNVQCLPGRDDTPAKVQASVIGVIAASSNLYGDIGPGARGAIAASLTEPVETFEELLVDVSDDASGDVTAPESQRKQKKHKGKKKAETSTNEHLKSLPAEQDIGKDKKVSTSWRGDVDANDLSSEAVSEAFRRPSDIFAFHALPIAKQLLHPNAKRKEVRSKIQTMLLDMEEDEWRKWIESLEKLKGGNETMLVRIDPDSVSELRRTAPTPAPIDTRERTTIRSSRGSRDMARGVMQDNFVHELDHHASHIKQEFDVNLSAADQGRQRSANPSENAVA
ncbi:hypothetical protein CC86DRAFT_377725 [Ophiobolus disseminans]|uniref:Uncharacterized protein n=1 Tax=Ophiobolus disseminans TaxID=1469910 RepID=A0A6A7AIP5_9PLEO|nr:hypothetical protein CC86DRAFT_377725 [Ophiobolus disseminans]